MHYQFCTVESERESVCVIMCAGEMRTIFRDATSDRSCVFVCLCVFSLNRLLRKNIPAYFNSTLQPLSGVHRQKSFGVVVCHRVRPDELVSLSVRSRVCSCDCVHLCNNVLFHRQSYFESLCLNVETTFLHCLHDLCCSILVLVNVILA